MRIGGAILVLVGIILLLIGFPRFLSFPNRSDPGGPGFGELDTSNQLTGFIISAIGMGSIFGGITLLRLSFVGKYAHYMASESRGAMDIVGRTAGYSMARGLRDAGGVPLQNSSTRYREIVKVKCRKCGYLDTEDADYCSKCGARL